MYTYSLNYALVEAEGMFCFYYMLWGQLDFLSGPTWFTIANHASMEMKFRTVKCQPTSVTWRACENRFLGPSPRIPGAGGLGGGSENLHFGRVSRWCYWSPNHSVRCAGPNTEERSQCLGVGLSRQRGLSSCSFVSHWKPRQKCSREWAQGPFRGKRAVSTSVLFETHIVSGHRVEGSISVLRVLVSCRWEE